MKFYYVTKEMPNGQEWEYTFLMDFDIADHFGIAAVKNTYVRVMKEWGHNIKAVSELYIALNMRIWYWYDQGNEKMARVYDGLWKSLGDWVYSKKSGFTKEDHTYFFHMTD